MMLVGLGVQRAYARRPYSPDGYVAFGVQVVEFV
jgi:hypothetical protein